MIAARCGGCVTTVTYMYLLIEQTRPLPADKIEVLRAILLGNLAAQGHPDGA